MTRTEVPIIQGDHSDLIGCLLNEMTKDEQAEFQEGWERLMELSDQTVYALIVLYCAAFQEYKFAPRWAN